MLKFQHRILWKHRAPNFSQSVGQSVGKPVETSVGLTRKLLGKCPQGFHQKAITGETPGSQLPSNVKNY